MVLEFFIYDRIALISGRRLWDQIANRISSPALAGWAYLLTPDSISSPACHEELSYALQRAIDTKSVDFPLVGLVHGVPIKEVPIALRVRLCVSLSDPDWVEEVRAGVAFPSDGTPVQWGTGPSNGGSVGGAKLTPGEQLPGENEHQ